jgi:hypothetical protein
MEGTPPQGPPGGPGDEPELSPEQQEMLRQMEEEMRRVRVQDVVTQSTVSILNLAARRIAKEDERDLEQGRIGIEAVRALVGLLDDAEAEREVRNALSQLQLMYAEQTEAAAGGGSEEGSGGAPQAPESGSESPGGPPPAPKQSGLWTPGRD